MKYKIEFEKNITRWEEALPLGNGEMGCLIWGSPAHLRFSLDRTDIWDKTPAPGTDSPEFTYRNLVRLAKEGDNVAIRKIFDEPYNHPLPTKLPAGKILLSMEGYDNVHSVLQLWDGQAELTLQGAGEREQSFMEPESQIAEQNHGGPVIRSVIHATRRIGMISVNVPPKQVSVKLLAPGFGQKEPESCCDKGIVHEDKERAISKGSLKNICYEPVVWNCIESAKGCCVKYFCQKVSEDFFYGVIMGIQDRGGDTEVFYRVVTSGDGGREGNGPMYRERAEENTEKGEASRSCDAVFVKAAEELCILMNMGYDRLLLEHRRWWKDFWQQSSICLPDKEMERNWYVANYLLASCSREGFYPMPLQGVWTADEDALPPWKGDYHNDLNTQMSYYHYLKANHLPQGRSFVDFLWERREAGRIFAKNYYGTGGLCLPAVMTIDGQPLGGWPMYSLSPTNQIWLCKAFADYYRYTGDEEFLRERAYPYFQETERCIGALLEEGEDGCLYLPISSSPEIHDDELTSFLTPNSNYDLALLHYLYDSLCGYTEKLLDMEGKMSAGGLWAELDRYRKTREKFSDLAVDERDVLKLAADEILRESHRHFSHAHAIHPLRLIKYSLAEHRAIIDATLRDLEELGTDMWVGFSFCWMAELYAIAGRGGEAAGQLRIFWNNFCSPNGFHLNGDQKGEGYSNFTYHPFTLEANMCAADALQEMLLYGEDGVIEVFPAIPETWMQQGTAFEKLRTERGILVSAAVKNNCLTAFVLEAPSVVQVKLRGWDFKGRRDATFLYPVTLQPGKNYFIYSQAPENASLRTQQRT